MQLDSRNLSVNPVFKFTKIKYSPNRLINKKLNVVEVDDKLNTVQCKDTETEPTVTRAENSLSLQNSASYFEVEILKTTEEDAINIGLISKDCNNKQFLGKSVNSFGYLKGSFYLDKKKVGNSVVSQKLKDGDRVGLGINCHKRTFFAVKNGVVIMKGIEIPQHWHEYIPAVSLMNENQKVRFFFSSETFQFKLNDYCASLENQIQAEIQNTSNFTNNQIYSLVHEYLSFKKYNQTLSLLNQKKIEFHKLGKYTKNPSISTPTINLQRKNDRASINEDSQANQPLKARGRIMSERLNENEDQLQIRRKNTEMIGEEDNVRKCSLISNLSNISNMPLSNLSEENDECLPELQQEIQEKINENQQFLDDQRLEIVELIKNKKILQAIALMQDRIPQIFQENYIMAFMKAHVFLQIVKTQSNREAIDYSRKQTKVLSGHFSTNFPFYKPNCKQPEWRPLFNIFEAMGCNSQVQCNIPQNCRNMTSDYQFEGFANFINKLILNKMGYLACSRLTYFTSHMKKIQQKLKQLKGMNCGIEFKA